jgi:hypothetical protein
LLFRYSYAVAAQHLRPKRWLLATAIVAAALFVAGLVFTCRQSGWTWLSLAFAGMTLIGAGGVIEVATSRVALHVDALECGALWSRRRYAVADIASVAWEKGGGVPDTVRAWLERHRAERQA